MKHTTDRYEFKSTEELWFSWYLDELQEHGLIEGWTYEEVKFELSPKVTFPYTKTTKLKTKTKVENKEKTLLNNMTYGPDFVVNFEPRASHMANSPHKFPLFVTSRSTLTAYIDVKGSFGKRASDIRFPDRQKMLYHIHRVYVQKIEIEANTSKPTHIFNETFLPKKIVESEVYVRDCKYGKAGESKIKYKYRTIKEWLKTL